jgi:hypothetical protein
MRGSTRVGLLVVSLICLFSFMSVAAYADKDDQLLDKEKGVLLRDVTSTPTNQPDALEFVNNGEVKLEATIAAKKETIVCTEIEFGGTVLDNNLKEEKEAVTLAVPFGVAEGDNCKVGAANVPTYFDTLATGAVGNQATGKVASITIADSGAGSKIIATVHNLKFSQNIPGIGFCTSNVDGKAGEVTNVTAGFVEEAAPNLNVQFTKAEVPIESSGGVGCPTKGELTGNFFLETPSTQTDTAFFKT